MRATTQGQEPPLPADLLRVDRLPADLLPADLLRAGLQRADPARGGAQPAPAERPTTAQPERSRTAGRHRTSGSPRATFADLFAIREFRALWIVRINAAARQFGLSYSRLIAGLRTAGFEVNRKMLADLAVRSPGAFGQLAERAKSDVA